MAESDDEVDYMSDAFLAQCGSSNDDVRPGLMYSHATKRKAQMDKKKVESDAVRKAKKRPFKEVGKDRLQEGLDKALDSNNKGFAMLAKMGYKPGTSLGKEGKGIIEPVKVDLKTDRVGLGWQKMITDHRRKKEERRLKRMKEHAESCDPEEYRARMKYKLQEKVINRDLFNSQRTCHQMDIKEGVSEPPEWWFWPSQVYPENDAEEDRDEDELEEDEEIEFQPHEQLGILTSYLRTTYHYCIWCGTAYNDTEDLNSNCAGSTREDHDD